MPAWAQALLEGNKALTETVKALQGEKVVNDRRSAILAKLKNAGEDYSSKILRDFGRMSFQDDDAFAEYLADVENDYKAFEQAQTESKLGKDVPFTSTDKNGKQIEASKEELDAVMGSIKF